MMRKSGNFQTDSVLLDGCFCLQRGHSMSRTSLSEKASRHSSRLRLGFWGSKNMESSWVGGNNCRREKLGLDF